MRNSRGRSLIAGFVIAGSILAASALAPARAADKVHVAKAASVAWTFTLLDIGIEQGIFAKYGLDVETSDMAGDARLQQALAAGSIDFGLGSGPAMALASKGGQAIAVAAFAGEPRNIAIIVGPGSPIKTVANLKDKLVGATTKGSLTEWLVQRLAQQQGWGENGINLAELGTFDAAVAALKTKQFDAMVGALEAGYLLEEKGEGKVLTGLEGVAPKFHTHVVFARKDLVQSNPDLVARFLRGVFASIAFMKSNEVKTTEIATRILHQSPAVMKRTYDYEISMFEDDGHFDPAAIAVLKDSFIGMGLLAEKPADEQLFTTRFLPVKP
jgi:ABC-type nitrate/sulfonate/bicarbonate transport system substrate-binding protein